MFEIIDYKIKKNYSDYAAIDDGNRYELINGELEMSPALSFFHQMSNSNFENQLINYVKKNKLGWVVYAPTDVILDDNNTIQPDILFISKKNRFKIQTDGVHGAPDLVVEIISPSSIERDREIKKDLYEKFGVKEYWLVDIDEKTVEVFDNVDGKFDLISFAVDKGKLISKLLPGFKIDIIDILPDL